MYLKSKIRGTSGERIDVTSIRLTCTGLKKINCNKKLKNGLIFLQVRTLTEVSIINTLFQMVLGAQVTVFLVKMVSVFQLKWRAIVMTIVGMEVMKKRDAKVNFILQ